MKIYTGGARKNNTSRPLRLKVVNSRKRVGQPVKKSQKNGGAKGTRQKEDLPTKSGKRKKKYSEPPFSGGRGRIGTLMVKNGGKSAQRTLKVRGLPEHLKSEKVEYRQEPKAKERASAHRRNTEGGFEVLGKAKSGYLVLRLRKFLSTAQGCSITGNQNAKLTRRGDVEEESENRLGPLRKRRNAGDRPTARIAVQRGVVGEPKKRGHPEPKVNGGSGKLGCVHGQLWEGESK